MIIWVNGAFGAGKTHVSHELLRRLDRGWVSDPEPLGFGVQRMLPPDLRSDFQDEPLWRTGVREVLGRIATRRPDDLVVVPMTLVVPEYFDEIVGRLRTDGHDVRHFALRASADTIRRRLWIRGLGLRDLWAEQQIDRCVAALARPELAVGIDTDALSLDQVVEQIAGRLQVELVNPRLRGPRRLARRIAVTARHIR